IITISNSAKKDTQSFFNYPQNKIFTTYLAADEKFQVVKSKKNYHLPDTFALYVGGVNWNKNLPNLIKACQKINLPLIFVGEEFLKTKVDLSHPELQPFKEVLKLIKKDPKIKCLGFIPTENLVDIYNLATVYVQPSTYEGFGLPVLEALSCGCPVVCGHNSSLPEIGGEAVIYTDTLNIEKLSRAIFNVIHLSKIQREDIIQKGLIQAKKFSWAKTARETYEIYQKVLVRE
ncbi:MAG: glycosyltransferase family 1 protein, partial [Patescibacteria group bacterium]